MKIKANLLAKFINKASINKKIQTINLDFKTDGVYSSVKSPDGVALPSAFMKTTAFAEYTPIGEIFVRNTGLFIDILKTFDEIELSKPEEYLLTINEGKRKADIILGSELVCDHVFRGTFPKLEFTTSVNVEKNQLSFIIKDKKFAGTDEVSFTKKGKELVCEVGSKGQSDHFVTTIDTDTDTNGTVNLGSYFSEFLEVVDTGFILNMGINIPSVLEESTEYIEYKCIIAPIIHE